MADGLMILFTLVTPNISALFIT